MAGGERKRKDTLGLQKIEIKRQAHRVPREERHVCFSEHRHGLFKKATKFCVRTGAHLAVIMFSPAGKPYSFGHPSVNATVERNHDPGSYVPLARETTHPAVLYEYGSEGERLAKAIQAGGAAAGRARTVSEVRGRRRRRVPINNPNRGRGGLLCKILGGFIKNIGS
ncbi:uncharacterized protein LOC112884711 [Panicum hallii]|uniref:uncharacterized protein LOC112884711 n=1 Tax=Panicum hallii TaxID=206008 RepID=UPI000DF4EC37|nr:uncharacterized protein LOC112884711 [Panicum hallii]